MFGSADKCPGDTAPLFGEVKPDQDVSGCCNKECLHGTRM